MIIPIKDIFSIGQSLLGHILFSWHSIIKDLLGGENSLLIPKSLLSFTNFMRKEIMQSNMKESTLKNHVSTLQILLLYQPSILFKDLTYNFLCDFERYLLSRHYNINTIAKHMKNLKRYLNLAINKELCSINQYPFRRYKIKQQRSRRMHLTPEELRRIEKLVLPLQSSLEKYRDMFLFSCYTGIRFSDVVRLTADNFTMMDNKMWLIYDSLKTDCFVRVPLFLLFDGKAIPIFQKYKGKEETIFNVAYSGNSSVNKQLGKICDLAKIEKHISFHCARHTAATLLLYYGANITTVQKLLGHKSVQTTEIYSNVMDMTLVRDLSQVKQNITKFPTMFC